MLEPGAILQDRYKIVEQIGKGGMGAVYHARDLRLRTDVALKETFFQDAVYRRAFEHEAQVLARLRHQALPRVIDHFNEGQGQFLVMEFIHGEDLGNQINRLGRRFASPQAMPMILRWTDQLLDALNYLHTRPVPVFHRDIKPKNLKLTQSYDIILLDFGLARGGVTVAIDLEEVADASANARKIYGFTPPYAPIEQMRDGEADPRSDLYSLAATMYQLLTGTLPVDAMTRMTRMISGQADPLKPIRTLAPHVPEPVAKVLEHALAVMIDERPASAREMRTALARARNQGSSRERPRARQEPAEPAIPEQELPVEAAPEPIAGLVPGEVTAGNPLASQTGSGESQAITGSSLDPQATLLHMLTTGSPIRSVAFNPAGDLLAAGYDDHTVGLWQVNSYSPLTTLKGHSSSVRSVAFAPYSNLLATGSDDETVRLWQANDGTFIRELRLPGCPVESIAFSPDGTKLLIGGWGGSLALCEVDHEYVRITKTLICPFVHSVAFSPDGNLIAAGGYDGSVYLWQVSDASPLPSLSGFPTFILRVAFSPDSAYLAASSNTSIQVWRMSDQKPIEFFQEHRGPVHAIAFSPNSQLLVTGSEDKKVFFWRLSDGIRIPVALEHRAGIASLAYSPDGKLLATGCHDGRMYLWTVGV